MTLVKIGGTACVLLLHAFLHCVLLHCIGWLFSPLMTLVKAEMPYWSVYFALAFLYCVLLHWLALFSSVRILMTLVKIGGTARVLLLL